MVAENARVKACCVQPSRLEASEQSTKLGLD